MTPGQLLRQVELPLALPSIVAGIRVATVIGVGTATIAAAVGAGGLGEYIFRGLSMVDSTVILAGAVPAALLALTIDGALTLAGARHRTRAGSRRDAAVRRGSRRRAVVVVVAVGAGVVSPLGRPAMRFVSVRRTSPSRSCSARCSRRRSRRATAARSSAG